MPQPGSDSDTSENHEGFVQVSVTGLKESQPMCMLHAASLPKKDETLPNHVTSPTIDHIIRFRSPFERPT